MLVVLASLATAMAQECFIDAARTKQGACTTRAVRRRRRRRRRRSAFNAPRASQACTGAGAAWLATTTWGRKTAWGCEAVDKAPTPKRCCVKGVSGALSADKQVRRCAVLAPLTAWCQAMLDFHNAERRCYGAPPVRHRRPPSPPPPPMRVGVRAGQLKWDATLELSARIYAAKCKWGHDASVSGVQGENLAAGTPQVAPPRRTSPTLRLRDRTR